MFHFLDKVLGNQDVRFDFEGMEKRRKTKGIKAREEIEQLEELKQMQ